MSYHRILEKQLQRFLSPTVDTESLRPLLQAISNYYESQERDKQLSEHAFAVSENEYQEVVLNLKEQDDIKRQSIDKLKRVVQLLDQRLGLNHEGEDELMAIVNDLEQRVERSRKLKTELQIAKDEAENLAKAKGNFLSVMSHEIRTPLNAIIGNIHLLEHEEHPAMQDPLIHSLRISSNNLLSLVNDILDFSKIDEGKIVFVEKKISLPDLMRNLRDAHLFKARENQNEIILDIDPSLPAYVAVDETRLSQVMNNLISNAIKFTQHGKIFMSAKLQGQDDQRATVRFSIRDTGIGIDVKKQSAVFERFTQANSDIDRKYGGSGLGLTIVKRLLELWGSKIFLASALGQGTEFSFELNIRRCECPETPVTPRVNASLEGVRILIVEDTEFNVQMAARMLTHWKAKVDVASNGQIAVEKCRSHTYDIILMDIQMPVMDGITAARTIRTFNTHTPIIALSASNSTEISGDVVASGMSDSVSKPFNPGEFFKILLKWSKPAESDPT